MRRRIARLENMTMIAFGGISVAMRLIGLLLAAIAVACMAVGSKELFPVLVGT